jgi:hypothetical protein
MNKLANRTTIAEKQTTHASSGNLTREFAYRRQIALKCGHREIAGRLIGLFEWIKSTPALNRLLRELRHSANADDLMFYSYGSDSSRRYRRDTIEARTIEEIAAVGLALIERAEKEKQSLAAVASDFNIQSGKYNDAADSDAFWLVMLFHFWIGSHNDSQKPKSLARRRNWLRQPLYLTASRNFTHSTGTLVPDAS